jgi:hypothetical protein
MFASCLVRLKYVSAVLSLMVLMGCNSAQQTTTSNPESHNAAHTGQSATGPKDADERLLIGLGFMKGHLIVAKELLDAGKLELAEPHVEHPAVENYAKVEDELIARKVPEFKTALNQLHELVKAKSKKDAITTQYQAAMQGIDRAIASIPAAKRQSPQFVMQVVNRLLKGAGKEYEAAIANGKITEAIEYQDSKGFIVFSEQLYQGIAKGMNQENPQKNKTVLASFAALKKAFPTVVPPASPVMTTDQMSQSIATILKNS